MFIFLQLSTHSCIFFFQLKPFTVGYKDCVANKMAE